MCYSCVNEKFKCVLEGNPQREIERERMAESELLTTSAASPNKLCKMSYPLLTTSWTLFSYLIRRKFYSNFKSCLIALFSRIWEKRLDITVSVSYLFYLYTEHNLYLNTVRYHNTSRYFKFLCIDSRSTDRVNTEYFIYPSCLRFIYKSFWLHLA